MLAALQGGAGRGAGRRPAGDGDRRRGQPGAASGEWAAELLDAGVSEFFPDELALVLNWLGDGGPRSCGSGRRRWRGGCRRPGRRWRTGGWTGRGRGRSPPSWAGRPARPRTTVLAGRGGGAAAGGRAVDQPAAGAGARELMPSGPGRGRPAPEEGRSGTRTSPCAGADGMGELRAHDAAPEAAESARGGRARPAAEGGRRRAADRAARASMVLHAAAPPGGRSGPAVTAHVEVVAARHAGVRGGRGAGAGREPVLIDGEPVTAAQARELLERLDALCPGGLQAPTDGTPDVLGHRRRTGGCSPPSPAGELADRETGAPRREGLGARRRRCDRYDATADRPQRRFAPTRDRTCRHPGCGNRAGWADLDHVIAHADGGDDRLRQPVLPVPPAPPAEDPRPRLALRHDARRRPDRHHPQRRHPRQPTTRACARRRRHPCCG